jgi:hypothetical protein
VQAFYQAIPGARALDLTGYEGYYEVRCVRGLSTIARIVELIEHHMLYSQYPCSTEVNMKMIFGSVSYSISEADFNLGPFTSDSTYCTGAVFAQDLSAASPISWIVGATFLKNVYSVFSYNPLAIGFASLAGESSTTTAAAGLTPASTTAVPTSTVSSGSGGQVRSAASSITLPTALSLVGLVVSILVGSAVV